MIDGFIMKVDEIIWAYPLVFLILGSSVYFSIRFRFTQTRKIRHQISLLFKGSKLAEGIKPVEAFCAIVAYRVGTANIAGVAVAILWGGPGAIIWMLITSLLTAAISYAECSLGQIYKIRQDGEFRGGSYYYLERGLGLRKLGIVFAILTLICVPVLTVGPHANSIALAFQTSVGIPTWATGVVIGLLLFAVISGGIQRIAKTATILVPIMTVFYLVVTIIIIVSNISAVPHMLWMMLSSAFGFNAMFGGLMGSAVMWGVRRSVNSSGAGMGEAVPAAAAARCEHPGEQGLINSLSVFIDVFVCFCTAIIILLTDCFNVKSIDGAYIHIGSGAATMAEQAASDQAGITWTQTAVSTVMPGMGKVLIAVCIFLFAFTTVLNYYYQGETALAYLLGNKKKCVRTTAITCLRIIMPVVFYLFSIASSNATWSIGEIGVGLMVWTNVVVLLVMSPTIVKGYQDYEAQYRAGKTPIFNPEKLRIKNAELWMEINKDAIESS